MMCRYTIYENAPSIFGVGSDSFSHLVSKCQTLNGYATLYLDRLLCMKLAFRVTSKELLLARGLCVASSSVELNHTAVGNEWSLYGQFDCMAQIVSWTPGESAESRQYGDITGSH